LEGPTMGPYSSRQNRVPAEAILGVVVSKY